MARWISTPRVTTSTTASTEYPTSRARSRRNGWLARLIGIFISIVPGHRAQISQQPRVVFAGIPQWRPQRFHLHRQLLLEQPLRFVRARAKAAEQQFFRAASQVVLHIDESRSQDGHNVFQFRSEEHTSEL